MLFPNPKRVSLDFLLVACKNLLPSRQVFLVKKFCLNVAENVKCRNSWFKVTRKSCSNVKIDKNCLLVVTKTESVGQTQKLKILKKKVVTAFNFGQAFRHFTFSATFKQNFFIRKTCREVNKCLQVTETKSKATLFGFGKSLRGPGKKGPTHLQTLEFLGIPHIVRS